MRNKPKHVGEGFVGGITAFGKGLVQGATGIVTKPVEGAKDSGVGGFLSGVGKAVIGVPLKPLSGALDAATIISEGFKNTSRDSGTERIRKPRAFGKHGELIPFDAFAASGQEIVSEVEHGRFSDEKYVDHIVIDEKKKNCLVLTGTSIFEIRDGSELKWRLSVDEIEACVIAKMNSSIIIKTGKKGSDKTILLNNSNDNVVENFQEKVLKIKEGTWF